MDCCYKLRQLSLLQSAMDSCYKLRQLFYYKLRQGLLQIATSITKCDDYYKLRQVLQSAMIITNCDSKSLSSLLKQQGPRAELRSESGLLSCALSRLGSLLATEIIASTKALYIFFPHSVYFIPKCLLKLAAFTKIPLRVNVHVTEGPECSLKSFNPLGYSNIVTEFEVAGI